MVITTGVGVGAASLVASSRASTVALTARSTTLVASTADSTVAATSTVGTGVFVGTPVEHAKDKAASSRGSKNHRMRDLDTYPGMTEKSA